MLFPAVASVENSHMPVMAFLPIRRSVTNVKTRENVSAHGKKPLKFYMHMIVFYRCTESLQSWDVLATYFSFQANHAVDWDKGDDLINDHAKKAKFLTLTSIGIGIAIIIIQIILIIVWVNMVGSFMFYYF